MDEYLIQGSTLTDIADAIREKTGDSALMTPAEMVEAIEGLSVGSSGLSAPYISASGTFTPTADASSITIPMGVSISNPILVEGHVIDQEDYLNEDYQYAALGFFTAYPKAVVSTNYNYGTAAVFCVLTTNANKRSYYQQGVSLSVTGSNLKVSNTRGVIFKAGIPIRYLVVGYDGTDG